MRVCINRAAHGNHIFSPWKYNVSPPALRPSAAPVSQQNYPDGYWQLRVEHARKQGAADGFQQGWHGALTRVKEGDALEELLALVPEFKPQSEQSK